MPPRVAKPSFGTWRRHSQRPRSGNFRVKTSRKRHSTMSTRLFQFQDAKSDKFWQITVDGTSHTVQCGRTGTAGQTQTKDFGSEGEAQKAAEKLIAEKVKKGYIEQGGAQASAATVPAATVPAAAQKASPAPSAPKAVKSKP